MTPTNTAAAIEAVRLLPMGILLQACHELDPNGCYLAVDCNDEGIRPWAKHEIVGHIVCEEGLLAAVWVWCLRNEFVIEITCQEVEHERDERVCS